MANLMTKHSISSELAQKMIDAAVAKAKELGVTENVAILDDGGNLKAFGRMDGAPILTIGIAQNKAYTALLGVSTQDSFQLHSERPVAVGRHADGSPCRGVGWRVPHQGERRGRRCDRRERGTLGAERCRLREGRPGARARCDAAWGIGSGLSQAPFSSLPPCPDVARSRWRHMRPYLKPYRQRRFQ